MKQCLDCGMVISHSNRAIRCRDCQKKFRKNRKTTQKQEQRTKNDFKHLKNEDLEYAIYCSKLPKEELGELNDDIARAIFKKRFSVSKWEYNRIYQIVEKQMFDYRCTRCFDLRDPNEFQGQTYCQSEYKEEEPTYNDDFKECKTPREFFAPAPKKKMRFLKDVYKGWKY